MKFWEENIPRWCGLRLFYIVLFLIFWSNKLGFSWECSWWKFFFPVSFSSFSSFFLFFLFVGRGMAEVKGFVLKIFWRGMYRDLMVFGLLLGLLFSFGRLYEGFLWKYMIGCILLDWSPSSLVWIPLVPGFLWILLCSFCFFLLKVDLLYKNKF